LVSIIIINALPDALIYRPHLVTQEKQMNSTAAAAASLLPSKLILYRALIKRAMTRSFLLLFYYILNKTMHA